MGVRSACTPERFPLFGPVPLMPSASRIGSPGLQRSRGKTDACPKPANHGAGACRAFGERKARSVLMGGRGGTDDRVERGTLEFRGVFVPEPAQERNRPPFGGLDLEPGDLRPANAESHRETVQNSFYGCSSLGTIRIVVVIDTLSLPRLGVHPANVYRHQTSSSTYQVISSPARRWVEYRNHIGRRAYTQLRTCQDK